MLRQGPLPAFAHGGLEYAGAAILIAAPFVLGFEASAATALAIVAGVALLAITAASDLPTGLARAVPVGIHVVLDFALAGLLIASPFLFGYRNESAPTAFFIVVGAVHVLVTIATRFIPGERR